jgi:hypothetical protein
MNEIHIRRAQESFGVSSPPYLDPAKRLLSAKWETGPTKTSILLVLYPWSSLLHMCEK